MAWTCRRWKKLIISLIIATVVFASFRLFTKKYYGDGYRASPFKRLYRDNSKPKFANVRNRKFTSSHCPQQSLGRGSYGKDSKSVFCNVPEQSEELCAYAQKLFRTDLSNEISCKETLVDLCKIKTGNSGFEVSCQNNVCNENETLSLGTVSPQTGMLKWKHYSFLKGMEMDLNRLLKRNAEISFSFIRCGSFWNAKAATQLFVFPPNVLKEMPKPYVHVKNNRFNVNLILIDSVSRPHFYRSLPQTVGIMRQINLDNNIPFAVLDFELVHAVKARTSETLHALFTGLLEQLQQSEFETDYLEVGAAVLFDNFKNIGYQTLWQEDMCWQHEWGLVRDLKVLEQGISEYERWKRLNNALKKNFIDHVGITHSSCEVYRRYGVKEPFHYPPVLCYSGRLYHEYFLEYLINFLKIIKSTPQAKPLFTFSMLCTGHEGSGKRIKTLDTSLEQFIKKLLDDKNTLTIIFSDHGNTYGRYAASIEGKFEAFHPHMFMIISDETARALGENKMAALKTNRKRLITVQDLHFMLMNISSSNRDNADSNIGLFKELSSDRNCTDLNLLSPSLCICDGFPSKAQFIHFISLLAEYALGQLNELILLQQIRNSKSSLNHFKFDQAGKHCLRLQGNRYENVKQTKVKNKARISLDIFVQLKAIFRVELQFIPQDLSTKLEVSILSYQRLTESGINMICRGSHIDIKLCVCGASYFALQHSKTEMYKTFFWQFEKEQFGKLTNAEDKHEKCLFILSRYYSSGIVIEAANACHGVQYDIKIVFSYSNMQSLGPNRVTSTLQPGVVRFIVVLVSIEPNIHWNWNYTLHYRWKTLA